MKEIVNKLIELNLKISTMESCTGGTLASLITDIPNASQVFSYGAVTYSNEAKIHMGVDSKIIETYSVYSAETAIEMSEKIIKFSKSDIGVGITGKLNKADANNLYNEDNVVYVCVTNVKNNKQLVKKFFINEESRVDNKLIVIKEVEKLIKEVL